MKMNEIIIYVLMGVLFIAIVLMVLMNETIAIVSALALYCTAMTLIVWLVNRI